MTAALSDRVTARTINVRPSQAVLSVLAFPFFLLGLLAGAVVTALTLVAAGFLWCCAAIGEGFDTGHPSRPEAP